MGSGAGVPSRGVEAAARRIPLRAMRTSVDDAGSFCQCFYDVVELQDQLRVHQRIDDDRRAEQTKSAAVDGGREIGAGLPAEHPVRRTKAQTTAAQCAPGVDVQFWADFEVIDQQG